jgi:uncharacterized Fe-S center protein
MMPSQSPKVFFVDMVSNRKASLLSKINLLFDALDLPKRTQGKRVGLKVHFGAKGNTRHLRPVFIRKLVSLVKKAGGTPFVVETCGHGRSYINGKTHGRTTTKAQLSTARYNGFTPDTVGCPILILDGERGFDHIRHEFNGTGKQLTRTYVAKGLQELDFVISAARFKGHRGMDVGGAVKNLAQGLVSKGGKGFGHHSGPVEIETEGENACDGCKDCLEVCPVGAISMSGNVAVVDDNQCVRCGECYSRFVDPSCPVKAIKGSWGMGDQPRQQILDNLNAILTYMPKENVAAFNFAMDITEECDCHSFSGLHIVPDQGIFASDDLVAVDNACYDAVVAAPGIPGSKAEAADALAPGTDKLSLIYKRNNRKLLEFAQEMGIGKMKYELKKIPNPQ